MKQKSFDGAIATFLRKRYGTQPTKFRVGQYVEVVKDFPSVSLKKGDRRFILAKTAGLQPCKHCPKGLSENYQLNGFPNVRFKVEHLKEVV